MAAEGWLVGIMGAALLVVVFGILILVTRYKRCASDEILVVFGKVKGGQASRCIHGGATLVWPLIQDYKKLSLIPMTINIPLTNALSLQNIRIHVPSTFTVGISTDPVIMNNAAERLLHLSPTQIESMASEITTSPEGPRYSRALCSRPTLFMGESSVNPIAPASAISINSESCSPALFFETHPSG